MCILYAPTISLLEFNLEKLLNFKIQKAIAIRDTLLVIEKIETI